MPIICNNYTRKFFKPSVQYKKVFRCHWSVRSLDPILLDFKLQDDKQPSCKVLQQAESFPWWGDTHCSQVKITIRVYTVAPKFYSKLALNYENYIYHHIPQLETSHRLHTNHWVCFTLVGLRFKPVVITIIVKS